MFCFHGGKKAEAAVAVEKVAELALAHNDALSAVDERRHQEAMGLQAIVQAAIERLGPAAAQSVAPVGLSVQRLWVSWGGQRQLAADEPIADEIRKAGELEFGPLQSFILKTDGFTFHTRKLSVEHPERNGFILAEVEDPIAEVENNPYARAVQTKARIRVQAKAGYRNGQIERLVVMDFIGEVSDAA